MISLQVLLAATAPLFGPGSQVETPAPSSAVPAAPQAEGGLSSGAEALRQRIHQMRMDLLTGGDLVREAEDQAIGFYREKAEFVERRLDTLGSDLSERRATYDVVLERALSSEATEARLRALEEAQPLRREISVLEEERDGLSGKRENLSKLIASVSSRERERQRLIEMVESTEEVPDALGMAWTGIGLAPPPVPIEAGSPLEDDSLLTDLLARDPRAARALLFDADPVGYWDRFPLTPPAADLRNALVFPLPDLPDRR